MGTINMNRYSLGVDNERGLRGRDRLAEPVSRGQVLRRERGQGNVKFPVHLATSRIGNHTD